MDDDRNWPGASSCDVDDHQALSLLQPLLSRWHVILCGKDPNSVEQQLIGIAWDDSIYRSYNVALRLAVDKNGSYIGAQSIADLIHRTFFIKQALAARRILESRATRPQKEVYSLGTILHEVKQNHTLITRENYVCYDGCPYIPPTESSRYQEEITCSTRHHMFDLLSGVSEQSRMRDDLIDTKVFAALETYFEKEYPVLKYVNKYLAHSANPENRQDTDPELHRVTLNNLQRLYRVLIWASKLVGRIVDAVPLAEVPTPQFDQFEGWTNAIVSRKQIRRVYDTWHDRAEYFDKWSRYYSEYDVLKLSPYR